jgi:hypothetical protein
MFQLSNTAGGFNTTYTNTIAIGLLAGKLNLYGVAGTGITSTGSSYATSTWTHVALVRTSGVTKLYINGTLDTTVGTAGSITDTTNYTMQYAVIGGYYSTSYLWNGYVSNLRVIKGTALYSGSSFVVPTSPLTAVSNTQLLTCQSSTFIDNSTNNFTLAANGDAKPVMYNPFGYTDTKGQSYTPALYGGSAYFDGTGDYLSGPTSQATLLFGTGDFTIECWVYKTSSSLGTVVSFGSGTGNLRFFVDNTTPSLWNGASSLLNGITINLNTWNHIVLQRSGTTIRFYTNGVSTSTLTSASNFSVGTLSVGGETTSNPFSGYITDLRLTKGAALYSSNFVPPLAPVTPTANTSLLLNMDKAGITDVSRNTIFENTGDSKIVYETPYGGSYYSNYFDGTGDYLIIPQNTAFAFPGDFTIEAWVYLNSVTGTQGIYSSIDNSADSWVGISLSFSGTSFLATSWISGNDTITHQNTVTTGQWYHIAIVRSGSTTKSYLNGCIQATVH